MFLILKTQAPDDREIFATILELFGETPRGSWLPGWVVLPSDQPLCPPPNQEHSCVTAAANKPSPPGRGGNAIRAENLLFPRVAVDFLHQRIKLPVAQFRSWSRVVKSNCQLCRLGSECLVQSIKELRPARCLNKITPCAKETSKMVNKDREVHRNCSTGSRSHWMLQSLWKTQPGGWEPAQKPLEFSENRGPQNPLVSHHFKKGQKNWELVKSSQFPGSPWDHNIPFFHPALRPATDRWHSLQRSPCWDATPSTPPTSVGRNDLKVCPKKKCTEVKGFFGSDPKEKTIT